MTDPNKAIEYMKSTTITQIQLLNSIMHHIRTGTREEALAYCQESKEQLIQILDKLN